MVSKISSNNFKFFIFSHNSVFQRLFAFQGRIFMVELKKSYVTKRNF